jgi:uracil-DNA glycosylase family 4
MHDPSSVDLSRAARLWLRGWQASGLTELPRDWLNGDGPLVEAMAAAPVVPSAPPSSIAAVPPQKTAEPAAPRVAPSPFRLPGSAAPTPAPTVPPLATPSASGRTDSRPASPLSTTQPVAPASPFAPQPDMSPPAKRSPTIPPQAPTPVGGSRSDRIAALQVIDNRVKQCHKCDELARLRNKTVFGVGNPEARLLFIGEAPGADEDAQGEPFVGKAGQLLDKIIAASGLRREDLYICNILKCRPPNNRTPEPDECANCREYLDAQLAIVDPEFIVCWGAVAATNLLGITTAIGKLRRKFHTHGRAKVMCTYHPSYLLRNPPAKKDVWEDMQLLLAEMGLPVPSTGG